MYLPDSNVLITRFFDAEGVCRCRTSCRSRPVLRLRATSSADPPRTVRARPHAPADGMRAEIRDTRSSRTRPPTAEHGAIRRTLVDTRARQSVRLRRSEDGTGRSRARRGETATFVLESVFRRSQGGAAARCRRRCTPRSTRPSRTGVAGSAARTTGDAGARWSIGPPSCSSCSPMSRQGRSSPRRRRASPR
jgi:hypothetical protein